MDINKHIIVAGVVIGLSGAYTAYAAKRPITPVLLGDFIFMGLLSLLDLFGGGLSTLASAIAMIAVVVALVGTVTRKPIFPWQLLNVAG